MTEIKNPTLEQALREKIQEAGGTWIISSDDLYEWIGENGDFVQFFSLLARHVIIDSDNKTTYSHLQIGAQE